MLSEIGLVAKSRRPHPLRVSTLVPVLVMACVLLIPTSLALASQCSPENGCIDCASKGEQLKCKFDALADEGDRMIGHLQQTPDLLTEAQRDGLNKAKDRLAREKGRVKPEDFHVMAKKKQASCQLVEIEKDGIGNDDGECQPESGEICVEAIGDGVGDEDGICAPMKGKNREVCAQICDDEAILQSESNVDENISAEIGESYDNMTDHLQEVNETPPVTAIPAASLMLSTDAVDPCAFNPVPERTSNQAYKNAKWAVMGTRSGADVAERFCDQTFTSVFWSWTLGAACIVAETAVVGVNVWLDVIETKEAILDAKVIDATFACAKQSIDEAGKTSNQIGVVEDRVTAVKDKQAVIIQLLNTSPGKRPDYPKP